MGQLGNLETISKIISHPTWDLLAILFFVAVGFFYGIFSGKKKLIAVLFSLYISALLFENFSYLNFLTKGRSLIEVVLIRSATFVILVILLAILFNKLLTNDYSSVGRNWWQIFFTKFFGDRPFNEFYFSSFASQRAFHFFAHCAKCFCFPKSILLVVDIATPCFILY